MQHRRPRLQYPRIIHIDITMNSLLLQQRQQTTQTIIPRRQKEIFLIEQITHLHGNITIGDNHDIRWLTIDKSKRWRYPVMLLPGEILHTPFVRIPPKTKDG